MSGGGPQSAVLLDTCAAFWLARGLGVPVVTRDARILAYAAAGHVRAIAC